MELAEIEAQLATRRLASRYCSAVDDGAVDRMAALFVPDGRLVVYEEGAVFGTSQPLRQWQGAEGFGRLLAVLASSYVRWVHFQGNHWADVAGDRAEGESYTMACHLRAAAAGQDEEVALIRYRDFYRRTSEGWRFTERHAFRQWTTTRPVGAARHEIDAALHGR